nr:P-loop NTPase fold protein [uncultured Albidiferax sp.]
MSSSPPIKAPEWLVFLRAVLLGAVLAEICQIGFLSSAAWGRQLTDDDQIGYVIVLVYMASVCLVAYAYQRQAHKHAQRVIASRRYDLGALVVAGVWIDHLLIPQLATFHGAVSNLDKAWSQAALAILIIILMSPVLRPILRSRKPDLPQLYFLSDAEIGESGEDALSVTKQATDFADTVLTSSARSGMVFGIDGPWGVGKTSFLNIATARWADVAPDSVIVFKFEPLRYASEPDLSERFIKDLCAKIGQEVFAPEFLPAATRYSRMLKGKTDVSIFGIKLTLEPSNETIDDLLGDIDNLLQQIDRRLIVIIDDLDRLEPKLVNNVLFTVRRTFKLSLATYILCYDTELLVAGKDEGSRARDFLEKFITAKLSLFVDLQAIRAFLETDWYANGARFQTIPADVMFKLREITNEAGKLISGPKAHNYIPLLGDLRKVKRFVNAMLLMNLEKTDLRRSDVHTPDLIHLVLLHLFYPGLFRRIHAEETEGRTGSFSVRRGKGSGTSGLENAPDFDEIVGKAEPSAQFLLKQLFDVATIKFPSYSVSDEGVWRTRACFNFDSRNLENYLQLIVRFKVPEVTTTFKMYKDLLDEVMEGKGTIAEILERPEFAVRTAEDIHDQFWRILVNNARQLGRKAAEDAITALVACLPRYSMLDQNDRSLRQRSIYSLVLLLDRAGFGQPRNGQARSSDDVIEIAHRILGDGHSLSLIQQLVAPARGPLGWEDLMHFRLTCCIDWRGQVHNVYSALVRYEDPSARAEGDVSVIALNSMRRFSQQVFQEFKQRYINAKVSFFADVDGVSDAAILGEFKAAAALDADVVNDLHAARSAVKSFVIYQLVNQQRSDGTGIGCGVFDEDGTGDGGGIHRAMCDYLFSFCFNPALGLAHARAFGDYCLRAFRDGMFENGGEFDVPSAQSVLTKQLGRDKIKDFWSLSGTEIKAMLADENRTVVSYKYKATYAERLPLVFNALDQLLVVDPPAPENSYPTDSIGLQAPAP